MTAPPAARGFTMPAEWAPHERTWLAWPHHAADWPGKIALIPWVTTEMVRHISRVERVGILVEDAPLQRRASAMLKKAGTDLSRVDFVRCPTDRSWVRDSGPTFVRSTNGRRLAIRWSFNAWAKYSNWKRDAKVADRIARAAGVKTHEASADGRPVVMEGGAIDVDGRGLLIATEECLLSDVQARNPHLDRAGIERVFAETLGIKRVVWLGRGIAGDDTHGHVDDLARFVAPGTVLLCGEPDPRDENHAVLEENRERLEGAGLDVIPLPMPAPLFFDGHRLPASYANFIFANGQVLVPTFNDANDRTALGVIAELFPDRKVIGIHAVDLAWGFGTLHCSTQQEPA